MIPNEALILTCLYCSQEPRGQDGTVRQDICNMDETGLRIKIEEERKIVMRDVHNDQ